MCGIVGAVGLPVPPARTEAALADLGHRGPDGDGSWTGAEAVPCWLGHTRLSIIDLSDRAGQPMVSRCGRWVMTYNGEIYNYVELAKSLQEQGIAVNARSDTAVLLAMLTEFGLDCLPRLNGMFAIALWDTATRRLHLVRDRFGVKPLFLLEADGGVVFSSEVRTLFGLAGRAPRVDGDAVRRGVLFGPASTCQAAYLDGVEALAPGTHTMFAFDDGGGAPRRVDRRWWDLGEAAAAVEPDRDELMATLGSAVELRTRSDVPFGMSLSGGIDSGLLAGLLTTMGHSVPAFTASFPGHPADETELAAHSAALAEHRHLRIEVDDRDWLHRLTTVIERMQAPTDTPSVVAVDAIMARARAEGVTVLIEGQGADEIFGGYPGHLAARLAAVRSFDELRRGLGVALASFGARALVQQGVAMAAGSWWLPASRLRAARRLGIPVRGLVADRHGLEADHRRVAVPDLAGFAVQAMERSTLPRYLWYADSVGMAHGVEVRSPFLDYRLVTGAIAALRRPGPIERTKEPLRRALHGLGNQRVADQPAKLGFPTSLGDWLRAAALAGRLDALLLARDGHLAGHLDRAGVAPLVRAAAAGRSYDTALLFRLLSAELWLRSLAGWGPDRTVPQAAPAGAG